MRFLQKLPEPLLTTPGAGKTLASGGEELEPDAKHSLRVRNQAPHAHYDAGPRRCAVQLYGVLADATPIPMAEMTALTAGLGFISAVVPSLLRTLKT